ncbi:hypothetical protein ACETU7_03185 [Rhodococcus sp. 3Y1]
MSARLPKATTLRLMTLAGAAFAYVTAEMLPSDCSAKSQRTSTSPKGVSAYC